MNTGRGDQGTGQPRSDQLRAVRGPAVWQQVIELLDRAFSDACEHVLEPGEGSTFASSHEATKLRSAAIVLPPRSLPKKVQLRRPTAMPRKLRSL